MTPPMPRKSILCLDFDGVVSNYASGWAEPHIILDPPTVDPETGETAIQAILRYMEDFCVCINSSRLNRLNGDAYVAIINMTAMARWLIEHGFPAERIRTFADYQPDGLFDDMLNLVRTKPPASITLDDRAITFDGRWPSTETLKAFQPWMKRRGVLPALGTPSAAGGIYDLAELNRRFAALDIIMRTGAEWAGLEGDPFSTENLERLAGRLQAPSAAPTAQLRAMLADMSASERLLVMSDLMAGYCKECGADMTTTSGICQCWNDD
jgi:hypothetical protein